MDTALTNQETRMALLQTMHLLSLRITNCIEVIMAHEASNTEFVNKHYADYRKLCIAFVTVNELGD